MHHLPTTTAELTISRQPATKSPGALLDIQQLRERGWTRQMVTRFLDAPDSLRSPSPGRGGRPAALYALCRVERAERRTDFVEARRHAPARSAMARESQRNRRDALLQFASSIELSLSIRPLEVIRALARDNSTRHSIQPGDAHDLDRILTHLISDLERQATHLNVFERQPGIEEARALLRVRQIDLIVWHYPELSSAARRLRAKEAMCPPEKRFAQA